MTATSKNPVPTEIRHQKSANRLEVDFNTGETFQFSAELLRIASPSAEVQGHGGQKPPPPEGKDSVTLTDIKPVGNYAVRLIFSDGHDSGLYSWSVLYDLGRNKDRIWADYQAAIGNHNQQISS